MKISASIWKALTYSRMDTALVAVLVLGSFGVQNSAVLLQPEQEQPPKALAVIPPANPAVLPSSSAQPAGAGLQRGSGVNVAPIGGDGASPVGLGLSLPGGQVGGLPSKAPSSGPNIAPAISFGNGAAVPQGGFAPASAGSRSAPAVPEPSTWLLMGLGAAMMAMVVYRERRKALGMA